MERKLASIQRILDIKSIDGADRIECARILGWECVIGKGEFNIGDLVVFFEVDSVTPSTEMYKLLKDSEYRIKTRRFRKQVSQGLCLPLSILPSQDTINWICSEGDDVTKLLEVTKYEPYIPAQLSGQVKGPFPEFLHKTDETRIQAVPDVLQRHKDKTFYVTEKLDGSSMTVYLNNGEFGVCSRNMDLKETEGNSFWKVVRTEGVEEEMRCLSSDSNSGLKNFAIQGELIGPGVQGNKYKLKSLQFFIFNVFNIDTGRYVDLKPIQGPPENFYIFDFISNSGFFAHVPLLSIDYVLPKTVEELVEFSKGKSILNPDSHREGIVLRPLVEEQDEDLGRLSFKCINPDFLLKYNDD